MLHLKVCGLPLDLPHHLNGMHMEAALQTPPRLFADLRWRKA